MNLKVFFSLSLMLSHTVFAASWKDNKLITAKHPCIKDVTKFCANSTPDNSNRWSCLGEKFNELSPTCSVFMKNIYKETNDCADDIFKFCTGASANYGRWADCLEAQKVVTPKCQTLLDKRSNKKTLREKLQRVCKPDFDKLCPKLTGNALYTCSREIFKKSPQSISKDCMSVKEQMVGKSVKQ